MTKEKAIYIIGGGPLGLNVIRWATELGLKTIVTDKNEQAPGFELADECFIADGSDTRPHVSFARNLVATCDIVGVYCGSEFGLQTIFTLSRMLELEHNPYDAIASVLDKVRMKRIWRQHDIPTPEAVAVADGAALSKLVAQKGTLVVKPARGSGSRGVQIVNRDSDFDQIFEHCQQSVEGEGEVIAEPFVAGRLIDANGVFIENEFFPAGVLEKFTTPFPDCLPIGGYDPAAVPAEEATEVYQLLERACRALGLTFGPVKGDFVRSTTGYQVLEVAPRLHGDVSTSNTLPYGTGINPVKFYFKYLAHGVIDEALLRPGHKAYATFRVICLPPGNDYASLQNHDFGSHDRITKIWFNPKYRAENKRYTNTAHIPGYICACGKNQAEAETVLEQFFLSNFLDRHYEVADKEWYTRLGESIESAGLSKKSMGYWEKACL
ncbi:MAG: acetyl-CoA carboxylase biotin carboxylase subunit family protein [bacterium]